MVEQLLQLISMVLLVSASLLLLFWKKNFSKNDSRIIKSIGFCVLLLGFSRGGAALYQSVNLNDIWMSVMKLPALIGLIFLMLQLFNYLEDKKQ